MRGAAQPGSFRRRCQPPHGLPLGIAKDAGSGDSKGAKAGTLWLLYKQFTEKKLGTELRKVARKFDMCVPDALAAASTRRCDCCNTPEGQVMDAQGRAGGKLRHCPCNANGRPLYCGAACQQKDWAAHREFCTADTS